MRGLIIEAVGACLAELLRWFLFYCVWSELGIGSKYFGFLPAVWQKPGFFEVLGIVTGIWCVQSLFPWTRGVFFVKSKVKTKTA